MNSSLLPLEIIGLKRPLVTLVWEDGSSTEIPARNLRLICRCAFCVEEVSGKPLLDPASVPQDIVATQIDLVGQYGMQVVWSDGHSTSIYSFRTLAALQQPGDPA